jgi:hypothetical protein
MTINTKIIIISSVRYEPFNEPYTTSTMSNPVMTPPNCSLGNMREPTAHPQKNMRIGASTSANLNALLPGRPINDARTEESRTEKIIDPTILPATRATFFMFGLQSYTSKFASLAFDWMKDLRGATSEPMRISNTLSASCASPTATCFKTRRAGSMVVSQSSSAFISPRPL